MKTVAVIAEFNPFHSGHQYFLQEVRKLSCADHILVLMSGDFVQRGEPAIWNKYIRTKHALLGGADLVLELPLAFSCGSAQLFASGSISILNQLNCIDELWFGSEAGDISIFKEVSEILAEESPEYSSKLKETLKNGVSFPKARLTALLSDPRFKKLFASENEAASFFSSPNNILGMEYCLALKLCNNRILPQTLKRSGAGYHDTNLSGKFPSASGIRSALLAGNYHEIFSSMPPFFKADPDSDSYLKQYLTADDFSILLKYRLLSESDQSLCAYSDISPDLARRIKLMENEFHSFSQFALLLKNKSITYSRISRCLMHILLDIRPKDTDLALSHDFVRLLGISNAGPLLKELKKSSSLRLVSTSKELAALPYQKELFASNLYASVFSQKYDTDYINDLQHKLTRID